MAQDQKPENSSGFDLGFGIEAVMLAIVGALVGAFFAVKDGLVGKLLQEEGYGRLAWIAVGAALGAGGIYLINRREPKMPLKIGVMVGGVLAALFVAPGFLLAASVPLAVVYPTLLAICWLLYLVLRLHTLTDESPLWLCLVSGGLFGAAIGAAVCLGIAATSGAGKLHANLGEGFGAALEHMAHRSAWELLIYTIGGAVVGASIAGSLGKRFQALLARLLAKITPEADRAEFLSSLTAAAVCALLTAGLQVASGLLALNEPLFPGHFTWSQGLWLAAILPQFAVAWAFTRIGEKTKDRALAASGNAFFLCLWGVSAFTLAGENFVPIWLVLVLYLLAALLGAAILFTIDENFPELKKDRRKLLLSLGVGIVGVGIGAAYLLKIPLHAVTVLSICAFIILVAGLLVFPLWWSICLMRSRPRLGNWALLLGLAQLVYWLVGLALLALITIETFTALADQVFLNEQVVQRAVEPLIRTFMQTSLVAAGLWGFLIAGFCLSVRRQAAGWPLEEKPVEEKQAAPETAVS